MTDVLNGPLELALRLVILLDELEPLDWNLDELLVADHIAVHSSDFEGPTSLHPPFPLRSADIGARRSTLRQALELLAHKGLVEIVIDGTGISFRASDEAHSVSVLLESDYAVALRNRCRWLQEAGIVSDAQEMRSRLIQITESWSEGDPIR